MVCPEDAGQAKFRNAAAALVGDCLSQTQPTAAPHVADVQLLATDAADDLLRLLRQYCSRERCGNATAATSAASAAPTSRGACSVWDV